MVSERPHFIYPKFVWRDRVRLRGQGVCVVTAVRWDARESGFQYLVKSYAVNEPGVWVAERALEAL